MIHLLLAVLFSVIVPVFLNPKALILMGYDRILANFISTNSFGMLVVGWIIVIDGFLEEKVFLPIRILLYMFIFLISVYLYCCSTLIL